MTVQNPRGKFPSDRERLDARHDAFGSVPFHSTTMADSEPGSPRPEPQIDDADPENTIKILLATDNHIGYMERDPIRGQDSINTFREILQLAVKHDVRRSFPMLCCGAYPDRSILFSSQETSFTRTNLPESVYIKPSLCCANTRWGISQYKLNY